MEAINEKLNLYKLPLGLTLVGIVLILGGMSSVDFFHKPSVYPKESTIEPKQFKTIKVDVSGAVMKPAVYSLGADARVEEAIIAAGGFSESANNNYIAKNLNLSQKIVDGSKIYVPFKNENYTSSQISGITSSSKLGVNSASQSQLEDLPGIGPASALKIINSRPYNDLNELLTKKAVTKSAFGKIKDLVDLN